MTSVESEVSSDHHDGVSRASSARRLRVEGEWESEKVEAEGVLMGLGGDLQVLAEVSRGAEHQTASTFAQQPT